MGAQQAAAWPMTGRLWVHGPGKEPWEAYVVKADADTPGKSTPPTTEGDACCGTTPCCTPAEQPVDPTQTVEQAKAAAGCACGR
jgi:hypothetical protein